MFISKDKNQKIKQDTEKYFKLTKQEQIQKLDSLGLTKSNIKSLKYEKDRVNKLLELMEKWKYQKIQSLK